MENQTLLQIGEIAKICSVSVQTIRYYDKIGFLPPVYIDEDTGYRYYSSEQIFVITNTKLLQSVGFTLKEIKDFLNKETPKEITKLYITKKEELETKIKQIEKSKEQIECYIDYFSSILEPFDKINEKDLDNIKVKNVSEKQLVTIRDEVNFDYQSLMLLYNQLLTKVFENNLRVKKNVITVFHGGYENIYHKRTDIELGFIIQNTGKTSDAIRFVESSKYISCLHRGKYPASIKTYKKMLEYCKENNFTIKGPVIHYLLVPIAAAENPEDTVFELLIPIKE